MCNTFLHDVTTDATSHKFLVSLADRHTTRRRSDAVASNTISAPRSEIGDSAPSRRMAPTRRPLTPHVQAASSSRGGSVVTVIAGCVAGATASTEIQQQRSLMSKVASGLGSAWESCAAEPPHSAVGGRHGRGSRRHHLASPALPLLHPLTKRRSRGRCTRRPQSQLELRLGLRLARQPPTSIPDRGPPLRPDASNPVADPGSDPFRVPSCRPGMGHWDSPLRC